MLMLLKIFGNVVCIRSSADGCVMFLLLSLIALSGSAAADMLKEDKTGGKKFMDFGGEIIPFAAANNIKV